MLRPDGPPASPAGGEPRARFGRANRLVRGWQYQRAFREGRSERGECVVAYAHVVPGDGRQVVLIALSVVPTVDFARLEADVARLMRNLGVLDS